MRGCVKSFLEVQNESVNLPAFIQDFSPVLQFLRYMVKYVKYQNFTKSCKVSEP